jgi:hypothetical protein
MDLLSSIFKEYWLDGFPWLYMKGNTYGTTLLSLLIEGGMAGELTSVIFLGKSPLGTCYGVTCCITITGGIN